MPSLRAARGGLRRPARRARPRCGTARRRRCRADGPVAAGARLAGGGRGDACFARFARFARPVLVNGTPGLIAAPDGQPISVMGVTIRGDKIVEIDVLLQTPNASVGWI